MDIKKLNDNFSYHFSDGVIISPSDRLRELFFELSKNINDIISDGREKDIVLEKLQEALFWSLRGIIEEDIIRQNEIKNILKGEK